MMLLFRNSNGFFRDGDGGGDRNSVPSEGMCALLLILEVVNEETKAIHKQYGDVTGIR